MAAAYDGHVEPDGAWIERRDGDLILRKRSVESFDNNVYLLASASSGRALLVDAAADAPKLLEMADGFTVEAVVQTHGHWDHIRAWDDLVAAGLSVWGHPGDAELFPHEPDRPLQGGEVIDLGDDLRVEVLHVPGHTPGSLVYVVDAPERTHLITGDSLFPGGPGNTFDDAEKFAQLMDGLEAQIFGRFDDDAWVYPGHGDDTTIGAERPSIPEWRARGW